jgi:hypothetical protein
MGWEKVQVLGPMNRIFSIGTGGRAEDLTLCITRGLMGGVPGSLLVTVDIAGRDAFCDMHQLGQIEADLRSD